ncbi:hypothetical protein GBA52_024157 [Prunus armeniaca]|nr:hypothetical protein GBA52_024157 [Prunus armeniaca]
MIFNFRYFVLCCVIAMPQLRIPSHEASTRSTDFASPAELLSKLSIFGFSLLSPKEQQDKIEQISNKLAAEDVNVGSLAAAAAAAGETKEFVADISAHRICGSFELGFHHFGDTTNSLPFEGKPPSLEFFKMSTPDLRGPRGATATQGGGQGAITQGGGRVSSRMICSNAEDTVNSYI